MSTLWLNGILLPERDAQLSPFDRGLTVGEGVFETLVARGGAVFAWTRHWDRLRRSADAFRLDLPAKEVLSRAMAQVIAANDLPDARLRVTITGGPGPASSARSGGPPSVIVSASQRPVWPATARVVIVPWRRNEFGALAGLKTTSYGENVLALAHAHARGGDEAVFANTRGRLCEGTGSNVFIVVNGIVMTPPLAAGCLDGVTRAIVLELLHDARIPFEEGDLPIEALASAEEVFLTSTTRDVQPVSQVNNSLMARSPGPITTQLMNAWRALVDGGSLDP